VCELDGIGDRQGVALLHPLLKCEAAQLHLDVQCHRPLHNNMYWIINEDYEVKYNNAI